MLWLFRIVFIGSGSVLCVLLATHFPSLIDKGGVSNVVLLTIAVILAFILLSIRIEPYFEKWLSRVTAYFGGLSPRTIMGATLGSIVGLLLSVLLNSLLASAPFYHWSLSILISVALVTFFTAFAGRNSDMFGNAFAVSGVVQQNRYKNPKIMDTNIIIDGRVVDLVKAGFLEGTLLVPQFVLKELQFLADLSDATRRARGRRGLEVLETLYESAQLKVIDWDTTELRMVDDKLVRLAKELGAKLLTNDFNLAKVAKVQNIEVLSINQLALAVKPKYHAGDMLQIQITKDGQQGKQGVGYLEDGTMVVVEDAIAYKGGDAVNVMVMSNIQTNVGRMIFARLEEK